jgi:hypothetical protein
MRKRQKPNPLNPPYQGDFRSAFRNSARMGYRELCSPLIRGARGIGANFRIFR